MKPSTITASRAIDYFLVSVGTLASVFIVGTNRHIFFSTIIVFIILFFLMQNGEGVISILGLQQISAIERLRLGLFTFFDISNLTNLKSGGLAILASFLGGLNTTLGYAYFKKNGRFRMKNGLTTGLSTLIVFIGVGCSVCGGVTLMLAVSALGLTSVFLDYITFLSYTGVVFLFLGTLSLLGSLRNDTC